MMNNLKSVGFGAVMVTALLAIPLLSSGASASTTSRLMHCASNSKSKSIECCESVVRGAVPLWMKMSGRNCEKVVKCTSSAGYRGSPAATVPPKKCKVVVFLDDTRDNGGNLPEPPQNPGRGRGVR